MNKVFLFGSGSANLEDEFVTIGTEFIVRKALNANEVLKVYSPYGSSVYKALSSISPRLSKVYSYQSLLTCEKR